MLLDDAACLPCAAPVAPPRVRICKEKKGRGGALSVPPYFVEREAGR